MVGFHRTHFPVAHSTASFMLGRYGVASAFVAQREVDAKLKRGDFDGALKSDQIRRELLDLIMDISLPAPY